VRYGKRVREPTRIGQYEVHEAIASGGMATVHFGRFAGPGGFARTVAVKRMHAHLCNTPEFVAMFVDEARLVARIRHPNVVGTLDVLAAGVELLIVMEYVHGEPLARLAHTVLERKARFPPPIASAILCDVLVGLDAAHDATDDRGEALGIVHRDVSPENILVGLDGSARVLDFGVAKAIGRLQVTREGQVKGKIAYMAPEQVRGGALDRRTDVYAASVVLWELLTGQRLFGGMRDGERIERILFGAVDAPAAIAPHVPEGLNDVVLRGLARDPTGRFPTARDMARALREAVRPASTSEVTDWVEAMAGGTLAERAATLAAIDRDHGVRSDPGGPRPDRSAPAVLSDRQPVVLHTDVERARSHAVPRQAADRRAQLRRAGTVLVTAAIVGAVSALAARPSGGARPDRTQSVEATEAGLQAPGAQAPASAQPPPPPPVPEPLAAPSAAPRKPAPSPPARPERRPLRIDCDPPYRTDADGTRIYKMQCL
jgi:eukaryotic-like serine/threonine-protein kinase